MASGVIKKLYANDILTAGLSLNDAHLSEALKFISAYRWDITDLESFDSTIDSGTVSFVRNRTGLPTSAYNYSPGIFFKPTTTESIWIMFGRNTNDIVMKIKNTTWESGWHYINSTT